MSSLVRHYHSVKLQTPHAGCPLTNQKLGMAKARADKYGGENQGVFVSDMSPIFGFSHMHDSGTGDSVPLGNFPVFAQAGCPNDDINACKCTQ